MIYVDAISRAAGCGLEESSEHLFLHCNIFNAIWHNIYKWLNVSSVFPFAVGDHFIQFIALGGLAKMCQSILQVLWFATSWEIWKERNNRLFNGKQCSTLQVVDKIKAQSFLWLKAKFPSLHLNYHGWWLSPFTILGFG